MRKRLSHIIRSLVLPGCLLFLAVPALASERQVNGGTGTDAGDCITTICKTINYATTQAADGDTIAIAAGTYPEAVTAQGKALNFKGASSATTIIDGGNNNTGVGLSLRYGYTGSSFGINTTVENLTIRNFNNSCMWVNTQSNAVSVTLNNVEVANCAHFGIYGDILTLNVDHSFIHDNKRTGITLGYGMSHLNVDSSTIAGNVSNAIDCQEDCTVRKSLIAGNGNGMMGNVSLAENTLFIGNRGYGLRVGSGSVTNPVKIINNTFIGNGSATQGEGQLTIAGGYNTVFVYNNLIAHGMSLGLACGSYVTGDVIDYNYIFDQSAGDYQMDTNCTQAYATHNLSGEDIELFEGNDDNLGTSAELTASTLKIDGQRWVKGQWKNHILFADTSTPFHHQHAWVIQDNTEDTLTVYTSPDYELTDESWDRNSVGNQPNAVAGHPFRIVSGQLNVASRARDSGTREQSPLDDYAGILRPQKAESDIGALELVYGKPYANAGADRTVSANTEKISLDGSKSRVEDGQTPSYQWRSLDAAGGKCSLTNENSVAPSVSLSPSTVDYTCTFALIVTDGTYYSATDTVTLSITGEPLPVIPTADAGSDRTVSNEWVIYLDGSGSSDPQGTPLLYTWTETSDPDNRCTIGDPTSVNSPINLNLTNTQGFSCVFSLVVSNGSYSSTPDTVTLTVIGYSAPVANAGNDIVVPSTIGQVMLDASKSSVTSGLQAYYWWVTEDDAGGNCQMDDFNSRTPIISIADASISYSCRYLLYVYDDYFQISDADEIVISVTAVGTPPVANAGDDISVVSGTASVVLDGSKSSDPEGASLIYQWTESGDSNEACTLTNGATSDKPTIALSPQLKIDYSCTYSLVVSDGQYSSTADSVTIAVKKAPDSPVANAGSNQVVRGSAGTVTLDGSNSSVDATLVPSYQWSAKDDAGGKCKLVSDSTASAVVNIVQSIDDYTCAYSLVVSDGYTTSAPADVSIMVMGENGVPVANAGDNVNLSAPVASITLDGSKSSDPDGTTLTYQWTETSDASDACTLTDTALAQPSVTLDTQETSSYSCLYSLVVSDGKNISTADTVEISVTVPPPPPPAGNSGGNGTGGKDGGGNGMDGDTPSDDSDGSEDTGGAGSTGGGASGGGSVGTETSGGESTTDTNGSAGTGDGGESKGGTGNSFPPLPPVPPKPVNHPPVACLSGPLDAVAVKSTFKLDASCSSDPDGDRLFFNFKRLVRPGFFEDLRATTRDANGDDAVASLLELTAPDVAADMTYEVTVSDGTESDTTQYTVKVASLTSETDGETGGGSIGDPSPEADPSSEAQGGARVGLSNLNGGSCSLTQTTQAQALPLQGVIVLIGSGLTLLFAWRRRVKACR